MTVRPAQMMHLVSQTIQSTKLKEALPGPAVTTNDRVGDAASCAYAISKCCVPPPLLPPTPPLPPPPPTPARTLNPQNAGREERGPRAQLRSLPATVGFSRRGHAAVQSIPTQLSCTRHLIHAVATPPKSEARRRRREAR